MLTLQIGKHKNTHRYVFMNNGGFSIFPKRDVGNGACGRGAKRGSISSATTANGSSSDQTPSTDSCTFSDVWNAREDVRLLDAVEQYGYGNWKVCHLLRV